MFADRSAEDPIAALAADLDAVSACELGALGDEELVGSMLSLERVASRLDAERIRWLGEVDARKAWALDGSRSPAAWLSREAGLGHGEATRRCKTARQLRDLPGVAAAFADGRLSFPQVRAFCQLVDDESSDTVREAFVEGEALLIESCAGLGERETRKVLRFWWARVDPEGYQARWDTLYDQRGLHVSETFEGAVAVDGVFDPDGGQLFLRALSAVEESLWRQDQAAVARGELCPRTAAQRRADAVAFMSELTIDHLTDGHPVDTTGEESSPTAEVANTAGEAAETAGSCIDGSDVDDATVAAERAHEPELDLDHEDTAQVAGDADPAGTTGATELAGRSDRPARGRARAPRTYGTVTVDLATLAGLLDEVGSPLGTPLVARDPSRWPGATLGPNEVPLPLEAVRRLCCDACLSVVVTDGRGVPLDVGRRSRTFTPGIRRALEVRDRGCAFGGCTMPPQFCDAHHIRWWRRDEGVTSLENGVLLCRHHHRLLHEGGWRCWLDPLTQRPRFAPTDTTERAPPCHHAA